MKNATFTKTYITNVEFDENDLKQIIELALKGEYATFRDKQQYEDTYDTTNRTLVEIFKEENYFLKYLGKDNLNSYHIFYITNGKHTIEIIMNDEVFRVYYNVN